MAVKKRKITSRVKYLDVSVQILAEILKLASKNALPKDAKVVRVRYEMMTNCWRLVVCSKEFEVVPEGTIIPKHGTPVISDDIWKNCKCK